MRSPADFATLKAPGPTVTALTQPFWDAAAGDSFVLQRCADCRRFVFYPRALCPYCWSDHLEWTAASGEGALETWSTIFRPAHPAWETLAPYTLGLVALAEGPTLLTHLLAEPQALFRGQPLRVKFVRIGEAALPFFEPRS